MEPCKKFTHAVIPLFIWCIMIRHEYKIFLKESISTWSPKVDVQYGLSPLIHIPHLNTHSIHASNKLFQCLSFQYSQHLQVVISAKWNKICKDRCCHLLEEKQNHKRNYFVYGSTFIISLKIEKIKLNLWSIPTFLSQSPYTLG